MTCQLSWWLLCAVFGAVIASEYHSVVEKVVYKYPGKLRGDLELPECGPYSVCSVMHLRFWQAPTIRRLCRCVTDNECPWKWAASEDDQYSMHLDNRSQLKFCEKVSELGACPAVQSALVVSRRGQGEEALQPTTKALCHCNWPAYWQLHRHYYRDYLNGTVVNINYFSCAKLKKCRHYEFCGNVVQDTFSTYYRCSCPVGTLCLIKDRVLRNTSELLYQGPSYRAYCLPVDPNLHHP